MYIYIYMHTYICMYIYIIHVYTYTHTHINIHICVYTYMYIYIYMYVLAHVLWFHKHSHDSRQHPLLKAVSMYVLDVFAFRPAQALMFDHACFARCPLICLECLSD